MTDLISRQSMEDKAVLLSIHPKYCELIASGKKTIEVRKTRPKIETPFKCYIYQTQPKRALIDVVYDGDELYGEIYHGKTVFITTDKDVSAGSRTYGRWGKVIGEFVCDEICGFNICGLWDKNGNQKDGFIEDSCLTAFQLADYIGAEKGYAWHISDLKIYDRPKELSEFRKCGADSIDGLEDGLCKYCKDTMRGEIATYGTPNGPVMCEGRFCGEAYETYLDEEFSLTRPPQSWCYVEERR